jgi:hypothetical protein
VKTLELSFDPDIWAQVPLEYPAGQYATQGDWATAVAAAYAEGAPDEAAARTAIEAVARALPIGTRPGLFMVLWHLVDPFRPPLLVNVHLVPDEVSGGASLTEIAGGYSRGLVRPPVVDTVESTAFGTVARVVSVSRGEQAESLIMRLSIAGRRDGLVVMLDARTTRLDHGALVLDDFTALMDRISIGDVDQ